MAWRISFIYIYLGSVWLDSVQSIKSRRKKATPKILQWFRIKRFKGNSFCQILFWNDTAYFIHRRCRRRRLLRGLCFFHSTQSDICFSSFPSSSANANVWFAECAESLTRTYNIHRFKCWHSFSPQIHFFFSFFVLLRARFRGFSPLTLPVSLSFLAFFLTSSFLFLRAYDLLSCGTCVFYFCLLWHLDTRYIIHAIM